MGVRQGRVQTSCILESSDLERLGSIHAPCWGEHPTTLPAGEDVAGICVGCLTGPYNAEP